MLDLTQKSLPNAISVGGRDFSVNTDFRIWMRFAMEYREWSLSDGKTPLDIRYLFKNSIPVFTDINEYIGILQFAFPQNVVPHSDSSSGDDVLFYQYDGDYIYSAFMQAYGIDLLETDLHWHKFLALMNGLPDCTRLSAIMGYRSYTGERNKDESTIYRNLKEAWMPPYEETEEEKNIRSEAIQKETKYATEVPMEVARIVHSILPMIDVVARKGNSNAVTDACVAMMCARTAILGALLNVRINLTSIKDEKFVKEMTEEADMIEKTTIAEEQKILDYVKTVF